MLATEKLLKKKRFHDDVDEYIIGIFWDQRLTCIAIALLAYMQSKSHVRGALRDMCAHVYQFIANIEPCFPDEAREGMFEEPLDAATVAAIKR